MASAGASGAAKGQGDLDTVVIRHASGATAEVYLWGATLASYKTPDGREQIFMSPGAIFDGKKALRGGIPLVFPQFGQPDKAMPQHGVARISVWTLKELKDSAEQSTAVLTLSDSPETREKWNHAFSLELEVAVSAVSLKITLRAVNTGDQAFDFNCLLHTYLKIPNVEEVAVCGLAGLSYADKVTGGDPKVETNAEVVLPSFTDRIYAGEAPIAKDVTVKCGGKPIFAVVHEAKVAGEAKACDIVVWNPYVEASPGDLPPPAFKEFICVEPGLVSAMHALPAGAAAELSQKIIPV